MCETPETCAGMNGYASIACKLDADCPPSATHCCADVDANQYATNISCRAQACGANQLQACDVSTMSCATCVEAFHYMSGYGVCL